MFMGWRGSADGAAVARALRHGIHHALSETVPEQPCTGKGERDLCVAAERRSHSAIRQY